MLPARDTVLKLALLVIELAKDELEDLDEILPVDELTLDGGVALEKIDGSRVDEAVWDAPVPLAVRFEEFMADKACMDGVELVFVFDPVPVLKISIDPFVLDTERVEVFQVEVEDTGKNTVE